MHLEIDAEKCTGCRICESFCSFHHEGAILPVRTRISILAQSDKGPFSIVVCQQCEGLGLPEGGTVPCADACPTEAITRDLLTGAWLVNADECIGCGACADACPNGALTFDAELGIPLKCDLCGGEPECAAMCPSGAIQVV